MGKKLLLFLFSLILLAQGSFRLFYFLDYTFHKEKYAVNCINKNAPALKCEGKCQLNKKISEEDSRSHNNSHQYEIAFHLALPQEQIDLQQMPAYDYYDHENLYGEYIAPLLLGSYQRIFHPPSCLI